jgi:hypothetical protein
MLRFEHKPKAMLCNKLRRIGETRFLLYNNLRGISDWGLRNCGQKTGILNSLAAAAEFPRYFHRPAGFIQYPTAALGAGQEAKLEKRRLGMKKRIACRGPRRDLDGLGLGRQVRLAYISVKRRKQL